jgi:deoxyribonuclease IV
MASRSADSTAGNGTVDPMRIGAHVRGGGELVGALARAHEIGAEVVQVFTQSPRMWKPAPCAPAVLERYRAAVEADATVSATYCHATYLINLATDDPVLLERSVGCLTANLSAARGMGASGLVLHAGSHRGNGFAGCFEQVAEALLRALDTARDPLETASASAAGGGPESCPILLENTAGAGGTVGRDFEELGAILDRAKAGAALGVCLDTQHLWASGIDYGTPRAADAVITGIDATVGLEALRCLHLNDSKVPLGANRDRHANLGEGLIGTAALGCLLAHPAIQDRAAILEIPGDGHGPRAADIQVARRALTSGRRRWAATAGRRQVRASGRQNSGRIAAGAARDAG